MDDVAVLGGGVAGLLASIALLQEGFSVTLIERPGYEKAIFNPSDSPGSRVFALNEGSRLFLERLGVWSKAQAMRYAPFVRMKIFENCIEDSLDFDCQSVFQKQLGVIVEQNILQSGLWQCLERKSNFKLVLNTLVQIKQNGQQVFLETKEGSLKCSMLIAADGPRSWLREHLNMDVLSGDYQQTAIVANIESEKPHQGIATQRFTPHGPLAFLPMYEPHLSSIVWSLDLPQSEECLALSSKALAERLQWEMLNHFGEIKILTDVLHYPLKFRQLKHCYSGRVVFVGDAAHTIHPLAGQGLNLGIQDVQKLVEMMSFSKKRNRDIAHPNTLRQYSTARYSDVQIMAKAMQSLKLGFQTNSIFLTKLRRQAFSFLNRHGAIKNYFVDYAMDLRQDTSFTD